MRILSLLAVVLAGCYDPAVDDCQFTCPEGVCPGDLACRGGLCRVSGASTACPCSVPPQGCSLVTNASGLCLAACTDMVVWNVAQTACAATGRWQLAVLGTTLDAARNGLKTAGTSTSWIGLTRDSPLTQAWKWTDGSGTITALDSEWSGDVMHSGTMNTCAGLDNGTLYSDGCQVPHAYACTSN